MFDPDAFISALRLPEKTPAPYKCVRDKARDFASGRGKTYGITYAEYEDLIIRQAGVCAICGNSERNTRYKNKPLSIDHCHETGHIRGLLCSGCNIVLGHARDNVNVLLAAAAYLEDARKRFAASFPERL